MAVEVALDTPLAAALTNVVQPKLSEVGWNTGLDDSALGEYIILMLVNGKTQDQIATELSNDLLSLPPEDSGAADFSRWLFEQVDVLNRQLNGASATQMQQDSTQASEDQGFSIKGASGGMTGSQDEDMEGVQDNSVPTGPKSMRNGSVSSRGAPNKRMMGQISRAMDRTSDSALHRVRQQSGERINMHNRQPPRGPRGDMMRGGRPQQMGRGGSMSNGSGPGQFQQITQQQQMQLLNMYEEQARMMSQIFTSQFGMNPGQQPAFNPAFGNNPAQQQPGRSLFERVENNPRKPNGQFPGKPHQNGFNKPSARPDTSSTNGPDSTMSEVSSSMEVESSQPEDPAVTMCRYNTKCTNQACAFVHQTPAAPPGVPVDMSDTCTFGAACKNKKCVGRHPSPAQKLGHQIELDCKFFPNCTNPTCPFRHPTMPMCKNGADCSREGCHFTHVRITCKYNPCLNPQCPYKHLEGQKRGKYGDKVWTADQKGGEEDAHVSERKFVDDAMGEEELIVPKTEAGEEQRPDSQHSGAEVVT